MSICLTVCVVLDAIILSCAIRADTHAAESPSDARSAAAHADTAAPGSTLDDDRAQERAFAELAEQNREAQEREAVELAQLSREASEASRALTESVDRTARVLIVVFVALILGIAAYWFVARRRDRKRTALAETMRSRREAAATAALDRYLGNGAAQPSAETERSNGAARTE
jgi:hypothetical protein